ncbi:WD40 domain-containing protein [Orpheovirus IHUMI-LCC2]|uniref:WD40 domain-containing protein n=1 Tax=Orpheovirus IHUMI-LCC2 TaxID=2023057 RepID=A0A2I2L3V2_9VIRU|nr:WD40 domain-containing protein [Orpheovirus IHUMI-LCC2]SNW62191.1 WD40 domain-containing protein [Orpheovirus IHUMI-LCC2]
MQIHSNKHNLNYVSHNQDMSCFNFATDNIVHVCDTNPFKTKFSTKVQTDYVDHIEKIFLAEMYYKSNIIFVVYRSNKHKVSIWNDIERKFVAELEFREEICNLLIRKNKIIVITNKHVYIYSFTDLKIIESIETYTNDLGICTANMIEDNFVLAVPVSMGNVKIYKRKDGKNLFFNLEVHESYIRYLCLDNSGKLLATCSEKGTIIRVFDVESGEKLHELRRGGKKADIQCIKFNDTTSKLCVLSNTGTVHIYDLSCKSSLSLFSNIYNNAKRSEYNISIHEKLSICFFIGDDLVILGSSGKYYKYKFGGDSYTLESTELFVDDQ